jgi:hypothetical protein
MSDNLNISDEGSNTRGDLVETSQQFVLWAVCPTMGKSTWGVEI